METTTNIDQQTTEPTADHHEPAIAEQAQAPEQVATQAPQAAAPQTQPSAQQNRRPAASPEVSDEMSMADFGNILESFEAENAELAAHEDNVLKGTVVKVAEKYLIVDVGFKSEGAVPLEQLEEGPFVMYPSRFRSVLHDGVEDTCAAHGFRPRVALEVSHLLRLRVCPGPELPLPHHVPERHQMRPAAHPIGRADHDALLPEEVGDLVLAHLDLLAAAHGEPDSGSKALKPGARQRLPAAPRPLRVPRLARRRAR